jgi:prepilin peptidase CpaA
MIQALCTFVLPVLMIAAAMTDVTTYKIPNWLTALIALLFLPMAWLTAMPLQDFMWHLAAGVALFCVGYVLFAFRIFGGGDSKLMAAAGLWFGASQSVSFLVLTAIAGGIIAVGFMLWYAAVLIWDFHGPKFAESSKEKLKRAAPDLPYGLAFAVGAILLYPQTWWMQVAGSLGH